MQHPSGVPTDEFADIAGIAARLGIEHPLHPSRLHAELDDGAVVSAIRWSGSPEVAAPTDATTVFLHGLGIESHAFDATALALGTPALALDLPGHGHSSWRGDADYSAAAVAPSVTAALHLLGTPPGILVGHSLGAIVAARAACLARARVTGLVLVDMSPDFTQRGVDQIVRALEAEPDFAGIDEVVERSLALRLGEDPAALAREARHSTLPRNDGRLVRRHHFPHLPAGKRADVGRFSDAWRDLESLRVPLLLVRGDRGYVSRRLAHAFRERLPAATVVTVPARHMVQTQAPTELASAIGAWRHRNDI